MSLQPPRPGKIVCVGRNYSAHAAELGHTLPEEPLIFLKPPSALVTDGEPIRIPPGVGRVDFEGEIAVIVAERAREVEEPHAWECIGWVAPLNDVTARELQERDSQWSRAKGFDTFCPLGPAVSAADLDPDALTVVTRVNGEERQRGTTSEMAFPIRRIVAHVSGIMTLEPGDVIATGTPSGVGPLAVGDVVEVEIEGVGFVRNPVEPRQRDGGPSRT